MIDGNHHCRPHVVYSVKDCLEEYINESNIMYALGCFMQNKDTYINEAVDIASKAYLTILDNDQLVWRECNECNEYNEMPLYGDQNMLINKVSESAKQHSHNVILIILSGGFVDLGLCKNNENIDVILYGEYADMHGGKAISNIIFNIGPGNNKTNNPGSCYENHKRHLKRKWPTIPMNNDEISFTNEESPQKKKEN